MKQVLHPETLINVNQAGEAVFPDQSPKRQLNRLDEYALELAASLKDDNEAVQLEAVSVGPKRVTAVLERAAGMGVHDTSWIDAADSNILTPLEKAVLLAHYAASGAFNLVLTGVMSEDEMNGQVGSMIAGILDLPFLAYVVSVACVDGRRKIRVLQETEGGRRLEVATALPAAPAIQSGLRRPRYPTLSNLLRAKKNPPRRIQAPIDPNLDRGVRILGSRLPKQARCGEILSGSASEKAVRLVSTPLNGYIYLDCFR